MRLLPHALIRGEILLLRRSSLRTALRLVSSRYLPVGDARDVDLGISDEHTLPPEDDWRRKGITTRSEGKGGKGKEKGVRRKEKGAKGMEEGNLPLSSTGRAGSDVIPGRVFLKLDHVSVGSMTFVGSDSQNSPSVMKVFQLPVQGVFVVDH